MMAGFEVGNAGQRLQGLADSGTLADMNPRFSGGAPWRARGWSQQPAGFCTGLGGHHSLPSKGHLSPFKGSK